MKPRDSREHSSRARMPFCWIVLASAVMSLIGAACAQSVPLEPTPSVDPTWQRIQSTGRIVVGTSGDYPPFEYYNAQYRLDGFDVALIQAVGQKLGLQVELKDLAFSGLGGALRVGQVDAAIAAISVTEEREAVVDFTDVYYVGTGVALAVQGSGIGPLSSIDQLAGYRVGVQAGSVYQADLQRLVAGGAMPAEKLLIYSEAKDGVADLQVGKIDLYLLDKAVAMEILAQGGVEIAGEGVATQRYAIAIPPGAATLQAEINRALLELSRDGSLARLSDGYLGTESLTVLPGPSPTPGATPTPAATACIDAMARIEDLTYDDDGMRSPPSLAKGEGFEKGWRIRNVGTCPWAKAYSVRYVGGNSPEARMDGRPTSLAGAVPAGETYEVYVSLEAPKESGTYVGFWQLFNVNGLALGETLRVGISVPTDTPMPTATATPSPAVTRAPLPTWTPTPPPVVGPNWLLVLIADESGTPVDPVPGSVVTAQFAEDQTLSGSTSCNTYTGTYKAKESAVKITNFSFTRLACPTEELNTQEKRYLLLFEKATRYVVSGNQLQLFRGDNLALVFQAQ